jgi:hypothetical protein
MGILNAVRAGLEEGAKRIKAYHGSQNFNPQLAGRHPSDNADMSALQLAPHMAKGLINDVVKYGSQAVTGEISDGDFLQQQPLTGQAKTIADAAGSAMGTALNYKVPSLMRGSRSIMDDISVVADGYRKVKPSLIESLGEPAVNRAEGAGLLGSMFIPAKIPKAQSGGLFSQAVIASDKLQRKTGNADGFFNDLTGKGQVKPDELNAMGFKENFAGRQDVSRQEVQQFVGDNQLQIKETVLGKKGGDLAERAYRERDDGGYDLFDERGEWGGEVKTFDEAEEWAGLSDIIGDGAYDTSKFGDYTLDGGDNYRELLMSLPRKPHADQGKLDDLRRSQDSEDYLLDLDAPRDKLLSEYQAVDSELVDLLWSEGGADLTGDKLEKLKQLKRQKQTANFKVWELNTARDQRKMDLREQIVDLQYEIGQEKRGQEFVNSGHFDEPNILAHLRMKDRVDTKGNKTLLIEEAQSDWHQKGGEYGYQTPELKRQLDDVNTELQAAKFKYSEYDDQKMLEELGFDELFSSDPMKPDFVEQSLLATRIDELGNMQANLESKLRDALPDAPFKTDDKSSWYNLALKRGLLEAVEGGYDKLALTTGRQQADRYDLSKQINEVRLGGDEQRGFTVSAFDKSNNPVIMESIDTLDALPNLIGKDAAKSLVDQPLTDTTSGSARILAGQDLSVGGEGMKQFYDRTLPNTLGKLVKQDGVKVGKSELPRDSFEQDNALLGELGLGKARASDTVHSIDITPKMRERVKKGLPLFATGGAAIGLGELMRQQQQERDSRNGVLHSL